MVCQRKTALMGISLPSYGGKWLQLNGSLISLNHTKFSKLILGYLIKNSVYIAFCKDTIYPLQSKMVKNTTFIKYWLYQYVMSSLSQKKKKKKKKMHPKSQQKGQNICI